MENLQLVCKQLTLERQGIPLIEALDWTLSTGEWWLLRGTNGSGKSSLLKCLAGLLKPKSGVVECLPEKCQAGEGVYCRNINYFPDRPAIQPELQVCDMLDFWSRFYHQAELKEAAINYFNLEPFLNLPCANLSAGWQRRVDLCRLILNPARIWLLDEPLSHLDEEAVDLLLSLIQTRKEQGGIILMAVHGHWRAGEGVRELILNAEPEIG